MVPDLADNGPDRHPDTAILNRPAGRVPQPFHHKLGRLFVSLEHETSRFNKPPCEHLSPIALTVTPPNLNTNGKVLPPVTLVSLTEITQGFTV